MNVFISYSDKDRTIAERLFGDLHSCGAEVFQYSKTKKAGKPSWEQVVTGLVKSEVFVVLISQDSLVSRFVNEEIQIAFYHYKNDGKPGLIIPAMIEKGVKPPLLIQHLDRIDLISYANGFAELTVQLGLKKNAARSPVLAPVKLTPLADFSTIFSEYKKNHPEPSPANLWSADAAKIVANYNVVAPKEIDDKVRSDHIDSILTEFSGKEVKATESTAFGKFNGGFFGLEPGTLESNPRLLGKLPRLSQALLSYDPAIARKPLDAPTVSESIAGVQWNEITGASAYALQESLTSDFSSPIEVYRGPDTKWPRGIRIFHYRVKAIGGVFRSDSAWSNPVQIRNWLSTLQVSPLLNRELEAPVLSVQQWGMLSWTEIPGASEYTLEHSTTPFFVKPEVVYTGAATLQWDMRSRSAGHYFRVKAKNGLWSNVVSSGA